MESSVETEIAVLTAVVNNLKESQDKKFKKLFLILEGNGNVGIVTQTALNKAAISRMWKAAGIGIALTSLAFGAIRLLA